ncbi:MAG: TonB-dependent receptor [Pseudomonadota bacterium]|jgi:iron complex outermembrane receptor protein/vitamin B12 transporter|nr:TonB-dependent receptor [Pseudomonadota bacterium]
MLRVRNFLCLTFALCLGGKLPALDGGASISGTVVDPTGAVVRGATVEVMSHNSKVLTATTDENGRYTAAVPSTGTYAIRVLAPGFDAGASEAVLSASSKTAVCDVTLRLNRLSQDVTVTATATPTLQSHLGAAVTVLGSNQVSRTDEVQDALRWIPGVQVTQTGRPGGTTALYIRGGNSDANKVLVDGIPMNDIGGAVEFADIASSAVSRIEVLRGPNSSVYGADAMAGVVSLTTRSGSTPLPEITYVGDGGNFASFRDEVNLGGKWKSADYFTDFARLDASNGIPGDRFHIATASGNYGWSLSPTSSLRATVRHDQLMSGEPNAILLYGIPDDAKQANEDSYFGATFESQTTPIWSNLVRYGGLRLRSNYTDFAATGIPQYQDSVTYASCAPQSDPNCVVADYLGAPVTITGANGYTVAGQAIFQYPMQYPYSYPTSTDRDFGEAQSDYRILPHLMALVGFEYEDERGYSGGPTNAITRRNSNSTLLFQGDFGGKLFYTAATGVEDNQLFGVVPTPRLSLAYVLPQPGRSRMPGETRIRASFGKGVNEPSIFEQTDSLYDQLAALPNGSRLIAKYHVGQIGPEWSRTYDGGVDQEFAREKAKVGITYFHNEFTNGIEYIPSQGLIDLGVPASVAAAAAYGATVNSQAFRAQGIEAEAQVQLSRALFVRGGYTYLNAVVQRSFTSDAIGPTYNPLFPTVPIGAYSPLIGARPFRRAPHSGYFGVIFTRGRFASLLTGTLVGRRDDSDFLAFDANDMPTMLLPNRNLDPAYQRIDLNASYAVRSHLQLTSQVQNLLSEHYSEAFGYPALPFTYRSGVQVTLGGESWKLK